MGFNTSYIVGGIIDEVKKVRLPEGLFPTLTTPFMKGFRIDIPAINAMYEEIYTLTQDMELIDIGLACSGYGDGDYWEVLINDEKIIETMYTKEIPEHINMGSTLYTVYKCVSGTNIKIRFHNESNSSKIAWFNLRFLK